MGFFSRVAEFYDFARGVSHHRYAAGDRSLVYQQQTYVAGTIKRSGLSESSDLARNVLDLSVPDSLPLLDLYRGTAPLDQIEVMLYGLRAGESTAKVLWEGEIGSVEWTSASTAIIHCLPPMASLQGLGLRRNWQKSCPHVVFGVGLGQCNADRQAFRLDATLSDVSGRVVKAAAFADKPGGWFAGGWIEWSAGGHVQRRFVVEHVGDTLTLLTPALVDALTDVAGYPGCDHTLLGGCTKLNDTDNFGGQPWIPTKNPFGGDPIY